MLLALLASGETRGPAFVVATASRPALRSPDGLAEVRILIDPAESPDAPAYLGRGTFRPGAAVAEHVHEGSTEILYLLEGEGRMTIEGQEVAVRAGDAVRVPRGARHSFRVTGDRPVEALQLYVPPGPEERFKAWPPAEPASPAGER
jgi:mannose-6-phosphate isomerase-like protein (cupin superfamily)